MKGYEQVSRQVEIEIRPFDAYQALRAEVLRSVGVRPDAFVNKDGFLAHDEHDGGGGHSWVDEIIDNKKPTQVQLDALKALNTIHSILIRD